MNIEIGKQYTNKTWRFLVPCLKAYGDSFVSQLNRVHKLAVGIHDEVFGILEDSDNRYLYILCDTEVNKKDYSNFVTWLSTQPYFVTKYSASLVYTRKEMLVVRIPEMFNKSYDMFLQHRFNEMFTEEEAKLLFSTELRKKELDIMLRRTSAYDEFIKSVKEEFNTDITYTDIGIQLELPYQKHEEVFNYNTYAKQTSWEV